MKRIDIKFIKFLVSGGSAALAEYGVFLLLTLLAAPLLVANSISFLCGLTVSFTLNKAWVFSSKGKTGQQLVAYALLATVNIVIANCLLWIFVEMLTFDALIAKIVVMIIIALWNFFFFSKIIFKQSPQP